MRSVDANGPVRYRAVRERDVGGGGGGIAPISCTEVSSAASAPRLPRRGDSNGGRVRAGVELKRSVLTNRGGAVREDLVVVDSGAQLAVRESRLTGELSHAVERSTV